jgi:acetoin:2,6-dichlorophenolindophenol oxidoreductase subunit alpha
VTTEVSELSQGALSLGLSDVRLVELLRQMLLIRAFDSRLPDLYTRGLIRGSSHAAIGQEAVAVGACAALRADDYITSTHRGHGHAIAKGADPKRMMAELFGRRNGYCHGKGGSMHIADFDVGMLGANGIVGGGFSIAAGAALSAQVLNTERVVLCFFGDGAINQGSFHGTTNLAAIWKLPVVFLCENNQFAMSGRADRMVAGRDLVRRAQSYDIPGESVDGMDVLAVYGSTKRAVDHARAGNGPSLLVANCYRFAGHFSGDTLKYRDELEARNWVQRDPVAHFKQSLLDAHLIDEDGAHRLVEDTEEIVTEAINWASEQSWPETDEAFEDLYA